MATQVQNMTESNTSPEGYRGPIKKYLPNNKDAVKQRYSRIIRSYFDDLYYKETQQDVCSKARLLARMLENPNLKNEMKNINDIMSMARNADEAMQSIINTCEKMKENLASKQDHQTTLQHIYDLADKAIQFVDGTAYGNSPLLDGSFGFQTVKIGEGAKDTITFSMPDLRKCQEELKKIEMKSNMQEIEDILDFVLSYVSSERCKMCALIDRLFNARPCRDSAMPQGIARPAKSLWFSDSFQQDLQIVI